MRTIRRPAAAAALVLALTAGSARPTFAQASSSQDAKPALKIGPVEVWPTMVFRNIGMDNNVYNAPENPVRDFTATISPNMEIVVRPAWMRLSYTSLTDFVWFANEKSERSIHRGFQARFDLNTAILQPYALIGAMQTKERASNEIDLRTGRQMRNAGAGVRARIGTGIGVSTGVRRSSRRFIEAEQFRGVDLATELDNETNGVDAGITFDVTPLTTVGLSVALEGDRFKSTPIRNSDSLRITPTVAFSPFGMFSGSATVGFLRFDAVNPLVEDYSGLVASGTIGMFFLDRYRIETSFSRDVQYSYDRETPTFVSTTGRGTVRTTLFAGLDVRVSGGRDVMNYRALGDLQAPGRDVYDVYGAGFGYTTANKMRFAIDAEFYERKSGRVGRGFSNNRIAGTFTWGVNPQ